MIAWLLERSVTMRGIEVPVWWAGDAAGWVLDAGAAVWFVLRTDAQRVMEALDYDHGLVSVTERMWCEPELAHQAAAWAVVPDSKDTELRDADDRRVDALIYMDPLEALGHGRDDCHVQPLVLAGVYNEPPGIHTHAEVNLRRKLDERNADCQRLAGALSEAKARVKHLETVLERVETAARVGRLGR